MLYKGNKVVANCLLCKNYHKCPCECAHCEAYDRFKISDEGKKLYAEIFELGYVAGRTVNVGRLT